MASKKSIVKTSSATSLQKVSAEVAAKEAGSSKRNSKEKIKDDDDLDDLADEMGEDFGFGFDDDQGDPNVKPSKLPAPESDPSTRQSTAISLTWAPIGQLLTRLHLQGQQLNPKKPPFEGGFDPTKGILMNIDDPKEAWCTTVSGLSPATHYVFRLVATNPAGTSEGPVSVPIETIEHSPDRGDKSGFLVTVDVQSGGKTLGRRLSFKKDAPSRLWYVLDGLRLGWYDKPDGKELGSLHMKDVDCIISEDAMEGSTSIVINKTDKSAVNLVARSTRPDISNSEYCKSWLTALRRAKDAVPSSFGSSTNTGMIF